MATAFTSEECNLLAQALDVAWDICRRSGDTDAPDNEATKAALTRAILDGYESGERNVRRLAIAAVAQLDGARPRTTTGQPQKPAA